MRGKHVPKLTKAQIADKFGISVEELEITE